MNASYLRTISRNTSDLHISLDRRDSNQLHRFSGAPAGGHVPWGGVFDALRDEGYDGWLTIERFGFSIGEISAATAIWRDIERMPDIIASEGGRALLG